MAAPTLLVATRKGLFTFRRAAGGAWTIAATAFLSDPVSAVLASSSRTTIVNSEAVSASAALSATTAPRAASRAGPAPNAPARATARSSTSPVRKIVPASPAPIISRIPPWSLTITARLQRSERATSCVKRAFSKVEIELPST